jgi:hypothetical protein
LSASKFIALYKAILLEIDGTEHDERKSDLTKRLVAGRSRLSNDASLIDQALAALKSKSVAVDPEVIRSCAIPKSTRYSFTRRSLGHTVSWGSTIESEISSVASV